MNLINDYVMFIVLIYSDFDRFIQVQADFIL